MASSGEAWKRHFLDMAAGRVRPAQFYSLRPSGQTGGNGGTTVELVTPTQQAVEIAKSDERQKGSVRKKRARATKRQFCSSNQRRNTPFKKKKTPARKKKK